MKLVDSVATREVSSYNCLEKYIFDIYSIVEENNSSIDNL